MIERVIMDMQAHHLLEEGGLRPAKYRLNYASVEFQDLLHEAFGDLFPRIRHDCDGHYYHENYDEESRETISMSRAIAPDEKWPEHEVKRLLEGWDRLRALAASLNDTGLQAMAYGLQLPDPAVEGRCYRIYTDTDGYPRMHILHGFAINGAHHAYLAETLFKALQAQMTVPIPPMLPKPLRTKTLEPVASCTGRSTIPTVLALSCVCFLAIVFLAIFFTTVPELIRNQSSLSDTPMLNVKPLPSPVQKTSFSACSVLHLACSNPANTTNPGQFPESSV